jgi:hypothetical protein
VDPPFAVRVNQTPCWRAKQSERSVFRVQLSAMNPQPDKEKHMHFASEGESDEQRKIKGRPGSQIVEEKSYAARMSQNAAAQE